MARDANGDSNEHRAPSLESALSGPTPLPKPDGPMALPAPMVEEQAARALAGRPAFSIRFALQLAFAVCFLLSLAPTLWSMQTLSGVEDRVQFLEVADDYMAEIQQARRFEKNFLLYGTDLDDALLHTHLAQTLAQRDHDKMRKILGAEAMRTIDLHLADYERLLHAMGEERDPEARAPQEAELRKRGAEMIEFAQSYVGKERSKVGAMLSFAKNIPFVFLGLLLIAIIVVASFLARRIMSALSRFAEYASRIGRGDFSPIRPTRRYRDEFTQLGVAFNRMLQELQRREQVLVESHKLRALGTLVAGVAHEINNPLNNIMLTAAVLKEEYEDLTDDEKLEMIDDLLGQTERSRKTVRNLLDFARESEAQLEPLDLRTIVGETLRLVNNELKVKKIHIETRFPGDVLPVHGDRQLLSEVFMNLIINAIDVLPEQGNLRVSVDDELEEGFVAVEVADDGPGIPEHILPRIFDPFFTTKPKGKGTGLGLSVAQGVIRKLGGYLRAANAAGGGSTFTVLLPVTTIPSDMSAGAAAPTAMPS
jgi:two-component system NtrC family sensor kinase